MSLDGYIADGNGGVSWLEGDSSQQQHPGSYDTFYEQIDTILLGYRTYHQVTTELSQEWPYPNKTSYVITHRQLPNTKDIIFTNQDPVSLIQELKQQEGKDIWLCGGAELVKQCMEQELIDQYWITIIPTILGDGISLFPEKQLTQKLKLIETKVYNGMVDLIYEPRN